MPNLKEFLSSSNGTAALATTQKQLASNVQISIGKIAMLQAGGAAEKLKQEVMSAAKSQSFAQELSDVVGLPKAGESKEQFITRAKAQAMHLLRKRLST